MFWTLLKNNLESIESTTGISFFAKFGDQQTDNKRRASGHYQVGLGMMGLDMIAKVKVKFENAAQLDVKHLWSRARIAKIISKHY